MPDENNPNWTDPSCCPYCGSEDLKDMPKEWKIREVENESDAETSVIRFHGINICNECGGQFETISDRHENERVNKICTLQFVAEFDDEEVNDFKAVKKIEGGEESTAVKSERADFNMMFGGCSEVQGPEYAIDNLYNIIVNTYDLPEEEEFEAGKWLVDD
jgi:hypothetical protein